MSRIAIIGLGTLGSRAASLLKDFELILIDRDIVEPHNIGVQILYAEGDIGRPKAEILGRKLDSEYKVMDINHRNIDVLSECDLILDCTDNLYTRFLLNDYCLKNGKPWIYAAAVKSIGRVFVVHGGACFRCFTPEATGLESCEMDGIDVSVADIVASMQAEEAINILSNKNYEKYLIVINKDDISKVKIEKREGCSACNGNYEFLNGKKERKIIRLCGKGMYQINGKFDYDDIEGEDLGECKRFGGLTFFKDGRVLIKADSEERARAIYSKIVGD